MNIEWGKRLKTTIRRAVAILTFGWFSGLLTIQASRAAEFNPVDLGQASLQSRTFEQAHIDDLVSACLAVIQDIRFQVVETASTPVVIVAISPNRGRHNLTISLQPTAENVGTRIRLALHNPVHSASKGRQSPLSPGPVQFYQDFFDHLNKTYFARRAIQ